MSAVLLAWLIISARTVNHMKIRPMDCLDYYRKYVPFSWGPEQQQSFDDLKNALTSPEIMATPRIDQPLLLTTDASNMSISFNLSQMIDGRERVIEYGARGLRKAELNYSTSEKELLAVVAGVQHYHDYLNGQKFIIRRLTRWNLILGRYSFEIQHTKGRENVVADALSRIELPPSGTGQEEELDQLYYRLHRYGEFTVFQIQIF